MLSLLLTYLLVYSILAVSSGYGVRCVCSVSVITVIKSASIMNNPAVLTILSRTKLTRPMSERGICITEGVLVFQCAK